MQMNLGRHVSGKVFIFSSLLLSLHASALCISIPQHTSTDTGFKPLALTFKIHATQKITGLNSSEAIDASFLEHLVITQSNQQEADFCNNASYVEAKVSLANTNNTNSISAYVGRDVSLFPASAKLTNSDAGYIETKTPIGSFSNTAITTYLTISSNNFGSVWSDQLNQYLYLSYTNSISIYDAPAFGYYLQKIDLIAYLESKLGIDSFYFNQTAFLANQNYQSIGAYGLTGTATLVGITEAVPEPETSLMFMMGSSLLGVFIKRVRRSKTVV